MKRDDTTSDWKSVSSDTAGYGRRNGMQRNGKDAGVLCGAALQCLRRPCSETMHTRARPRQRSTSVAERLAERQRWATYWLRGTRGYVATRAEGEGGRQRVPALPRSTHRVLTEYPTGYPSRRRGADGSERSPTAAEARTEYSQSTPQGTRVGEGGRTGSAGLRIPRLTAPSLHGRSLRRTLDPRANTRTRSLLRVRRLRLPPRRRPRLRALDRSGIARFGPHGNDRRG